MRTAHQSTGGVGRERPLKVPRPAPATAPLVPRSRLVGVVRGWRGRVGARRGQSRRGGGPRRGRGEPRGEPRGGPRPALSGRGSGLVRGWQRLACVGWVTGRGDWWGRSGRFARLPGGAGPS